MAILISDTIDFKTKIFTRDKRSTFIMIKVSTHEEETVIINIYVPNNRAPKYTQQKLKGLKGEKKFNSNS